MFTCAVVHLKCTIRACGFQSETLFTCRGCLVRAPYDTTFDSYFGPTSVAGPPGSINVVNAPCRYVPIDQVFQATDIGPYLSAGMTTDNLSVTIPQIVFTGAREFAVDLGQADQIAIPSGSAPQWYVARADEFLLPNGTIYARYWLAPLPYPF